MYNYGQIYNYGPTDHVFSLSKTVLFRRKADHSKMTEKNQK